MRKILVYIPLFLAFFILECIGCNNKSNPVQNYDMKSNLWMEKTVSLRTLIINNNTFKGTLESLLKKYDPKIGIWTDINYQDSDKSGWEPVNHLRRIKSLIIIQQSQTLTPEQNLTIQNTVNKALDNWHLNKYTSSNWFQNEIAANVHLSDIYVLYASHLSIPNQDKIKTRLNAVNPEKRTGVNLIWMAILKLKFAIVQQDEETIAYLSKLLASNLSISQSEDGIMPDYSYLFHNSRLQMFAYGQGIVESYSEIIWLLNNTPYAFSAEKLTILRSFILEGWQWMSRGKFTIPATLDRSCTRKEALLSPLIIEPLQLMKEIDPLFHLQYDSILKAQQDIDHFALEGKKAFPYADFGCSHSKSGSIFLKVLSDRQLPTESINNENLQGEWLNYGNHYFVTDGTEYTNIMGCWDWNLIPGFTYVEGYQPSERNTQTGIAHLSNYIIGTMPFHYSNISKDKQIHLNKSFFIVDNQLIVLISAFDTFPEVPIITSIDQCKFQGNAKENGVLIQEGKMNKKISAGNWLTHHGWMIKTNYSEGIEYQVKKVKENWQSINAKYKKEESATAFSIFNPIIKHSNNLPFYYTVQPEQSKQGLAVEIISNSIDNQCIYIDSKKLALGTIHNPRKNLELPLININIKSDIAIQFAIENYRIFVAEPSLKSSEVNIILNNKPYTIKLDKFGKGFVQWL